MIKVTAIQRIEAIIDMDQKPYQDANTPQVIREVAKTRIIIEDTDPFTHNVKMEDIYSKVLKALQR